MHPREFNIPLQQVHPFENILFQNTKNHNLYALTAISFLGVIELFLFFQGSKYLAALVFLASPSSVYSSAKWG